MRNENRVACPVWQRFPLAFEGRMIFAAELLFGSGNVKQNRAGTIYSTGPPDIREMRLPKSTAKGLGEIGDEVIDVLCSDRKPDGIRLDPLLQQLFLGELGVGGRSRMDH